MIVGIVLAAGASRRMGTPKSLLPIGNTTFVRRILDAHRDADITRNLVVLAPDSLDLKQHLAGFSVALIVNQNHRLGQLSSILAGLNAAMRYKPDGALIHPVDHPAVTSRTIRTLVESFVRSHNPIVIPTSNGRRGHPVLFSSATFEELRSAPMDVGARSVVHAHCDTLLEVETGDPGVLLNVDTPADVQTLETLMSKEVR